jgi:hypothetical protein
MKRLLLCVWLGLACSAPFDVAMAASCLGEPGSAGNACTTRVQMVGSTHNFNWHMAGGDTHEIHGSQPNQRGSYRLGVQECSVMYGTNCSPWLDVVTFTAASGTPPQPTSAPGSCRAGYVWRDAVPGDHLCVLPPQRNQAQLDNAQAAGRRLADGETCKQGFVWREATPTDHVCVTPETRKQIAIENQYPSTGLAGD